MTGGATTHYLKATNFGFTIPGGSVIDGIVVEVERKENSSSVCKDSRIRIVKGGSVGSTDKSSVTEWPTTDTYKTYGGAADLWGETWSSTDINDSTFGFALSALGVGFGTAQVDHIRITVYYH